jgi:hypothetical protein
MSNTALVNLYYATYHSLKFIYKLLLTFYSVLSACFAGFWLGVLKRDTLLAIDERYYSTHARYQDDDYNRSGLWTWEDDMMARYFEGKKQLVLVGAGAGREVLALGQLGYEVKGFECNADLVKNANTMLEQEGFPPSVELAPPDICPPSNQIFGGLIVGWGAYMLIQGRAKRIALLRSMREQSYAGTPLLVSFFVRRPDEQRYKIIAVLGNFFRGLAGRDLIEVGDDLEPEYVHYFTEEELSKELAEAGFRLEYFAATPYGHAVAFAQ